MKTNHDQRLQSAIAKMSDAEFRATVFIAKLTDPQFANAYFKEHKLKGKAPQRASK